MPEMAYIESVTSSQVIADTGRILEIKSRFETLHGDALSRRASLQLIREREQQWKWPKNCWTTPRGARPRDPGTAATASRWHPFLEATSESATPEAPEKDPFVVRAEVWAAFVDGTKNGECDFWTSSSEVISGDDQSRTGRVLPRSRGEGAPARSRTRCR
jgi:hypothetical protein